MLKDAYLLAKIGADTAENERNFANNWQLLRAPRRAAGDPSGQAFGGSGGPVASPMFVGLRPNSIYLLSNYLEPTTFWQTLEGLFSAVSKQARIAHYNYPPRQLCRKQKKNMCSDSTEHFEYYYDVHVPPPIFILS